jgi:N-acetyl-D-muramate 6-phosphate phosphatase
LALKAVLFDLDGTLLDTAPDMVGTLNSMRLAEGLAPLPFAPLRAEVSHGSARLVQIGFPGVDAGRFALLQRRFLEAYGARLAAETRLFDGMDRVLGELSRRGLPAGIVTNKPAHLTDKLLEELGLRTRFVCVVSGDTLKERKPHPLPMLHAAELAGAAPDACVYVGDAERDVQAAHAAGMRALVAVYGYLSADEDWAAWRGDGSIQRPAELLDWIDREQRLSSQNR